MLKIVGQMKGLISWLKEKLQSVLARPVEQVAEFMTSPLTDTEYALLKRVSGIVGTAVAVYLTIAAGISTALVVIGLCLLLSIGLYKVSPGPCLEKEPSSGLRTA